MGINSDTLKLKSDIANLINNSKLPPVNIMLVLNSLEHEVNQFLNASVQDESKVESQVKKNGNPDN